MIDFNVLYSNGGLYSADTCFKYIEPTPPENIYVVYGADTVNYGTDEVTYNTYVD